MIVIEERFGPNGKFVFEMTGRVLTVTCYGSDGCTSVTEMTEEETERIYQMMKGDRP